MNETLSARDEKMMIASEKYMKAKLAKERYQRYYDQLLEMRPAERQEAMKLSHYMRSIADLKEKLNGVCAEMDISNLGYEDVVVRSLEADQLLNVDGGKVIIDEAVEVILPDGRSFTLQPIGVNVPKLKRELQRRQMMCDDILERTHAKDIYELRRLSEDYEDLKRKMIVAKNEFEILLKEMSDKPDISNLDEVAEKFVSTGSIYMSGSDNSVKIDRGTEDKKTSTIIDNPNFDTYVAIDIETNGLSPKRNSIIELAAVKVVDGVIHETKEFAFDELVNPGRCSSSKILQSLTGISDERLQKARPLSEVLPDFMDFIGDNTIVGYNFINFDFEFLKVAGAECNIPITNSVFDILPYLRANKKAIGYDGSDMKLKTVADYCGIGTDVPDRCVDNALYIAKIYKKLKELKR